MHTWLALELADTIRHDGEGGVADFLAGPAELTGWVRDRAARSALSPARGRGTAGATGAAGAVDTMATTGAVASCAIEDFVADDRALREVLAVRTAVRALLGHAVAPRPPSRADAGRLPSAEDALAALKRIARRVPVDVGLEWAAGQAPQLRFGGSSADPVEQLTALLAREAMLFLAGPDRLLLAACGAPRCVRYFLKGHGRQEYCKPSCSNRARAARHYERRRAAPVA